MNFFTYLQKFITNYKLILTQKVKLLKKYIT